MKTYQQLIERKESKSAIIQDVIVEAYYDISKDVIADIISSNLKVKVTDTLIEAYVELAASRKFTLDPVILEIRKQNKLDNNLIENKLEFVLNDSSTIIITEESFTDIKKVLENNLQAIEYMNESKENFMKMFNVIKKYKDAE